MQIFLFIGLVFSPLAVACAFIITYGKYTIPAKSTVAMNFPKAERIIYNGVKGISKVGDRFTVSLNFEKFGQVPVWVEIRATPE